MLKPIRIIFAKLVLLATALLFAAAAPPASAADKPEIKFIDADRDGNDSPGDELLLSNGAVSLRFRFVRTSTAAVAVDPKLDGWFLDTVEYRGEKCFKHPDWDTESKLYPTLETNDVVGMSAFVQSRLYKDEPFLWMWNLSKQPAKAITPDMKWFPDNQALPSYKWYTLYEKHEVSGDSLVFTSSRGGGRDETIGFSLNGPKLDIAYTLTNKGSKAATFAGIITFPANRIIDTVFAQPGLAASRKVPPTGFTDNYTFTASSPDGGLPGSGMLFWSLGKDSLLHMDGIYSWQSFIIKAGESATKTLSINFLDRNIDDFYSGWLAENKIDFDPIDWKATEDYLVSKVPLSIMPDGYVWHAYDYNPPGTPHDWHNEMTGRALIVKNIETGDKTWLDRTTLANKYYIKEMLFNDPNHICYGYFKDQTYADKQHDCYLWSQPYNVESLIAEYAVTKSEDLKKVLLVNFEKVYSGPLYNAEARRWYWTMRENGTKSDFGVFDAQEFGADVMISAYEFTGDKKYLDRAVEVISGQKHALDNFGLLLEDRAGEPSVNTFAFAAKILFKLYDYTGDAYWLDRATRILNATVYSRVFMENFPPEDAWLKGALARKDGDWRGQTGPPNTGTDSSAPSETTYIPWVMEALVAGYSHTGNEIYIKYIGQLLRHQLEANKKLLAATGGKFELCGHYNMFTRKFEEDNDGLTVVSNLFLFPYVRAFQCGACSPNSSVLLYLDSDGGKLRAFHLSGIEESVSISLDGWKAGSIRSVDIAAMSDSGGADVAFDNTKDGLSFKAAPYQMYFITLEKKK